MVVFGTLHPMPVFPRQNMAGEHCVLQNSKNIFLASPLTISQKEPDVLLGVTSTLTNESEKR
jgi:hypothetical protein